MNIGKTNKFLDEYNWKILEELQRNARITAVELGKRINLSAPAVSERIRKLEDEGYIKGYRTLVDYDKIAHFIPEGENIYVVIMTVGYRSDEKVIRLLLDKKFKYMGILGSQAKADKLKQNLHNENFNETQIAKLHLPIGLKIKSPALVLYFQQWTITHVRVRLVSL